MGAIAATFVCLLDVIEKRLQVHGLPEFTLLLVMRFLRPFKMRVQSPNIWSCVLDEWISSCQNTLLSLLMETKVKLRLVILALLLSSANLMFITINSFFCFLHSETMKKGKLKAASLSDLRLGFIDNNK
ncbi:hypothetical protein ACFE04_009115 [Oxalis oulophora]